MVFPQFGFTDDDVHNDVVRYVVMDNKDAYPFNQYHSHEYSELMFFINGGGKHNINFKEYEIQSGSVHVLAAGDVHWLERSPESTGFVIVYKDAFLYKLMENTKAVDYFGLLNDSKVFSLGAGYGQLRLLMMEIQQQQHDPLYLYNLLGALFTKLAQLYHSATTQYGFATKPTAPQTSILQSFINLLEKEYLNRLLLEDYAKKLNLTEYQLRILLTA
jgi:AraC family transcriptional activator of pobA